jgi:hypothetical protein
MLRTIRCHNPKCKNTYLAENGRRRLCDACREAGHAKAVQKQTDRVWKSPARKKTKLKYWEVYRDAHRQEVNDYNREWMRRKRAGLPTSGVQARPPVQKPAPDPNSRFKRCFRCAYWMDKGDRVCKRCGWK